MSDKPVVSSNKSNDVKSILDRWAYYVGLKQPPTPFYGGSFYDQNFNLIYIKEVIYHDPATIVFWSDGTKTTAKCQAPDVYDPEKGVMMCTLKKLMGTERAVATVQDWGEPEKGQSRKTLADVRAAHKQKR